jgi:surface protein
MKNMFNGAASFNQPLDKWDVSSVAFQLGEG